MNFFNQFALNFLRPYGPALPVPDDETISRRTNQVSCEWFLRPDIAMSEFAESITANLKILQKDNLKLVKKAKFSTIANGIAPMLEALDRLNKKPKKQNEDPEEEEEKPRPTKDDIKTVLSTLYDADNPLDKAAEEMFLVGNAMFTTAIQYIVARSLFSDPATLAKKLVKEDPSAKAFKNCPSVKGLRDYLHAECVDKPTTTSRPRTSLMKQLEDSSDDEEQTTHSRTSSSKRPRIEDSPDEQDVVHKPVTKGKKNKNKKQKKTK